MKRLPTTLDGLVLIEPVVHGDERGFFIETFRDDVYRDLGVDATFVQDNHSRSAYGVLRGLHYQDAPGQAKLIRVARGRVYDVAVDIRPDSPTFGRFESVILDDSAHHQLYIPPGFAHGFATISPAADVVYKVGSYYDGATERGLAWDDPELAIQWPLDDPVVSRRDQDNPRLREIFGAR
jgi:dTDP-4-dehydrorhamnose 3,5-epimerase